MATTAMITDRSKRFSNMTRAAVIRAAAQRRSVNTALRLRVAAQRSAAKVWNQAEGWQIQEPSPHLTEIFPLASSADTASGINGQQQQLDQN
jgi:hypothetical protein